MRTSDDRTCMFSCPNCGADMYIPVDFAGAAFTCPHCGKPAEMQPEWVAQLQQFAAISDGLTF